MPDNSARVRREPAQFRRIEVRRFERRSPRLLRVTLTGAALEGLTVDLPAASVRLLLPQPGVHEQVVPTWNGNEFLLPDGRRPTIRTFTPARVDREAQELDVEIVLHGEGAASAWAVRAQPGDPAAVSGPGRGYTIADDAPAFLLAGDETAIPAVGQLLEAIPEATPVHVHIEAAGADARIVLPRHPNATIRWHDLPADASPGETMAAAVRDADLLPGTRVWVAGEAAAVQRIRRHLFDERAWSRRHCTVRGYWKHGRKGDAGDDS